MNIRHFVSGCFATSLLGLTVAACAVDGSDPESARSENAIKGAPGATPAPVKVDVPAVGNAPAVAPSPTVVPPPPAPILVCDFAKCSNGYHCEEPVGCVPNQHDCSTVRCAAGTTNIPSLGCCLPTCGGFLGTPCAGGTTCVDDPSDNCDPQNGGSDCMGVCVGGTAK